MKWLTDERKVDFIVAPYEADAQLAYLANNGIVDAVITEDSDLVAFGCPNVRELTYLITNLITI
jgi:5'-3' exonuclease